MKKILALVSLLVLAAACATQPSGNKDMATNANNANKPAETKSAAPSEADIIAKEKASWDVIKKKDWDGFAKMLTSELLLEVIEHAEEIHGLAGQTELHLVEKRKRDARVLTIYDGTNEIQRFFILKDLVEETAPRWATSASAPSGRLGREEIELEALKLRFRQRVESAGALFGSEVWQNPSLQANCFLLSEAAAWLKAADSILGRIAWLDLRLGIENREPGIEDGESGIENRQSRASDSEIDHQPSILDAQSLELGRRALARCYTEIENRLKRFDEELMHLRRGYYAPEIRAAWPSVSGRC